MGLLDIMSRIVSILVGLATLAEKSKPYIKRLRKVTEKDPSARACLKIHSRHLHAPLCSIFGPNSLNVAHYAAFI